MSPHREEERAPVVVPRMALLLAVVGVLLMSCSFLFPHTELAIAPEGATLDELGIALMADIERWIESLLWLLGIL